ELGVSAATLYAYISRGKLQSEPVPGQPRERRYHRADIERLKERKESLRDPAKVAARGLHWGSPGLSSTITLIHDGRLYYRGQDAAKLAAHATLEQVAELLWDSTNQSQLFRQPCILPLKTLTRIRAFTKDPMPAFQIALPIAGAKDLAAFDFR